MRRAVKYIFILAALSALAGACAEPTAPRAPQGCSGGGTQDWERCALAPR